jgi:hypothetical protein
MQVHAGYRQPTDSGMLSLTRTHAIVSILRSQSSPGATSLRSGSSSCIVKAPSSARDSKRKQVSSCSSTCALALYTGSLNFSGLRALSYLYSSSSFCAGQRQPDQANTVQTCSARARDGVPVEGAHQKGILRGDSSIKTSRSVQPWSGLGCSVRCCLGTIDLSCTGSAKCNVLT